MKMHSYKRILLVSLLLALLVAVAGAYAEGEGEPPAAEPEVPTMSPGQGFYKDAVKLELSAPEGATIY